MRRKPEKHVTKKKETEPAPIEFGGFLAGAVTRFLAGSDAQPPAREIDWESLKRAVKRRRQERERDERLERLERQEVARKRAANTSRKCPLWHYVAEVKRKIPAKRSDHAFIAKGVDVILIEKKRRLIDVCPKPWRRVPNLPVRFEEARLHPLLKGRVKVFIAKVPVS